MFKRNSGSWILKGSSPLLFLTYNKDTSKIRQGWQTECKKFTYTYYKLEYNFT